MLNAQWYVRKALYYNIGVEDGRTMKATEDLLARAGVDLRASKPTKLFETAMRLRKLAQELTWRS